MPGCDQVLHFTPPTLNARLAGHCAACSISRHRGRQKRTLGTPFLSWARGLMANSIVALVSGYAVRFWPLPWPLAAVSLVGGVLVLHNYMLRRKVTRNAAVRVLITGAGGHIGYSLTTLIAKGNMLGPDTPVVLHLLDVKQALGPLEGLKLELLDLASPLLRGVLVTDSLEEACQGVHAAIMLAGAPRRPGADRREIIESNVRIYREQAVALEAGAAPNVKVVVVASPANTNAFVLHSHARSIPARNITCLSRLDHNRTVAQVAAKTGVGPKDVTGVVVWGNHSLVQFPDARHARVRGRPVQEALENPDWLTGELVARVQERGKTIMQIRTLPSAASAAGAICDHVRDWLRPSAFWRWRQPVVSMGVMSDGSYGVPPGIFFSFPVRCGDGEWRIEKGIPIDDFSRPRLQRSTVELLEERRMAIEILGH